MNLYNEIDPYAADWLENLIAAGHIPGGKVDRRSIKELTATDLAAFTQCHFFSGIAGWPYALRLAGWPEGRPIWTGSAPCQPFSAAGKQEGFQDERDLWPDFFRLIREGHPEVVMGEQVANSVGFGWLDRISADLETEGYAVWAIVLGAHSVGAPHIRQRLYWVAFTGQQSAGRQLSGSAEGAGEDRGRPSGESGGPGGAERVGVSFQSRLEGQSGDGDKGDQSRRVGAEPGGPVAAAGADGERLADAEHDGGRLDESRRGSQGREIDFWSDYDLTPCSDGKARRFKPGIFPLVNGVSGGVAVGSAIQESAASLSEEEKAHVVSRIGVLKGAGNAIVPQVAAEFARAFMEIRDAEK